MDYATKKMAQKVSSDVNRIQKYEKNAPVCIALESKLATSPRSSLKVFRFFVSYFDREYTVSKRSSEFRNFLGRN